MKRIILPVLALVVAGAVLTGCDDKKKSDTSAAGAATSQ